MLFNSNGVSGIDIKMNSENYDKNKPKIILRKKGVKPVKSPSMGENPRVHALNLFRRLTNNNPAK